MQSVHGIQVLVIGGFHKLFGKTLFVFAYKYRLFNKIKVEIIYNATLLFSSENSFIHSQYVVLIDQCDRIVYPRAGFEFLVFLELRRDAITWIILNIMMLIRACFATERLHVALGSERFEVIFNLLHDLSLLLRLQQYGVEKFKHFMLMSVLFLHASSRCFTPI